MKRMSKKRIIQALEATAGLIIPASKKLGISDRTLYRWIEKDEELKNKLIEIREKMVDLAETALMHKVKEGDITAIIFLLKCLGKNRGYNEKEKQTNNEKINIEFALIGSEDNKKKKNKNEKKT